MFIQLLFAVAPPPQKKCLLFVLFWYNIVLAPFLYSTIPLLSVISIKISPTLHTMWRFTSHHILHVLKMRLHLLATRMWGTFYKRKTDKRPFLNLRCSLYLTCETALFKVFFLFPIQSWLVAGHRSDIRKCSHCSHFRPLPFEVRFSSHHSVGWLVCWFESKITQNYWTLQVRVFFHIFVHSLETCFMDVNVEKNLMIDIYECVQFRCRSCKNLRLVNLNVVS